MREHRSIAYHMTVAPIIGRATWTPPTTLRVMDPTNEPTAKLADG